MQPEIMLNLGRNDGTMHRSTYSTKITIYGHKCGITLYGHPYMITIFGHLRDITLFGHQ